MRLFKWSPTFRCSEESPVVPVWISLPFLPVHLVLCKEALFSIAAKVGKPLRIDHATALLNRPNVARVLVEFDVSQDFVDKIWIEEGDEGFWQDVSFETEPKYCLSCKHLGHRQNECHIANPALRGLNKTNKEKDKPGDGNTKSDTARESQGKPHYVPVEKPLSSSTASLPVPVPPASTVMVPDPVQVSSAATTSSECVSVPYAAITPAPLASVSSPVSTQLPAAIITPPVSSSTVVTVRTGSLPPPVPAITQPPVTTFAPSPAFTSSAAVPGPHIATSSPSIPVYIPYGVPPTLGYYPGNYGVMTPAPIPLYDPMLGNVALNYQSEEVPSNRSFLGRIGASHSARSASTDDESGGENYGSYFHDKFPSADEQLHDDDCTRELIARISETHSGPASTAALADKSLDDDGFQQPKRSERLRKKKAKGLAVGSTVTG